MNKLLFVGTPWITKNEHDMDSRGATKLLTITNIEPWRN
jgi:hypothetical protein